MKIKSIYLQVKDAILDEISHKESTRRALITSERGWAEQLGVSRMTVRKAVDELVAEGRIVRIPGVGLAIPGGEDDKPESGRNGSRRLAILIRYSPDDEFVSRIIMGCCEEANQYGYSYIIHSLGDSKSSGEELIGLIDEGVAGFIASYDLFDKYGDIYENFIEKVMESGLPLITHDIPVEWGGKPLPCVLTDDRMGGYAAGEYLIKTGHRKVLFISRRKKLHTVVEREQGLRDAFIDAYGGAEGVRSIDLECFFEAQENGRIADLIDELSEYTAFFGYSDDKLYKVCKILDDMGRSVPDDISLIGYGDLLVSRLMEPALTTVEMPIIEMGIASAKMLIEYNEGRGALERITLPVRFVERESVKDLSGVCDK